MERCTHCGSELPGAAQFCGYCGGAVITPAEMPTNLSDYPDKNVLVDNSPTALSGSPHFNQTSTVINRTPMYNDDLTALSKRSTPHSDDPTILSNRPSQPGFRSGERDAAAGRSSWPRDLQTPPLPMPAAEEDEEERRRNFLLGLPGQAPAGNVPMIQGTPQLGGVPMVQGSPQGPSMANLVARGATPFSSTPSAPNMAPNTPLLHTEQAPAGSWPRVHAATPSPDSSTLPEHGGTSTGGGRPAPRPGGGSCALSALILAVVFLVIVGTIGGLFFGFPPSLTIIGNSNVTIGDNLHLHGTHFFPGSAITLSLDGRIQLYASGAASAQAHTRSATALQMNALNQLLASNTALKADGGGSFDIILRVEPGWGVGAHTLHATESIGSRSAVLSFTVAAAAAKMVVTPSTLDFGKVEMGNKATLSIVVNNAGGKALSWKAVTDGTTWLNLQPASGVIRAGDSAQFIYVTGDATHLKAGNYSATLTITSNGGDVQVTVNLQVVPQSPKPQAKINVAPTSLDFGTLDVGQQLTKSIAIGNSGNLALNWQADTGNANWVTLDQSSQTIQPGAQPDTVNVTVDTTNLGAGNQTATITINSNGGKAQVSVTVFVNQPQPPPPHQQPCSLQAPSPASESFNATVGASPDAQTFSIGVTGGCADGVTITPTVSMDKGTGWLAVSPASATISSGSTTFTVTVTSSSLAAGTYTGSVSLAGVINGAAVDSSPQTVSVTLTVTDVPPTLSVDTTAMSFTLSNGDSATSKPFKIANTGGSTMDWTAALNANAPSFVTLSSANGTGLTANTSATDNVDVNPSGQAAGTYQATVTIKGTDEATGNAAQNSPATISISITITAQPSMQLSTNSLKFTPGNCTYTDSSPVSLTNTGGGTLAWSVADPVYTDSGDPGAWLSVSPSGTGSGDTTFTFAVDGSGAKLVAGQTYTATVTITGTDQANGNAAGNSPQTVSVSFTIPYCLN